MIKFMRIVISCITLIPAILCARITSEPEIVDEEPYDLWYTGTYLSATSVNISGIEPFITVFGVYGEYNSDWKVKSVKETLWSINPMLEILIKLNNKIGLEFNGGFLSNFKGGEKATHLTDSSLILGYEISTDQKDTPIPNCRLGFQTIFPTGNYKHLDPKKSGVDITGGGAYFFGPILAFSKTFRLPCHFFNLYWSVGYFIPTYAYIKGLSVYGGGFGTRGKIHPGRILDVILSGEYSLANHWVFALDFELIYLSKSSHFHGRRGQFLPGIPALVGLPSSISISVAPQLEYCFSAKSGILFGAWCSVAGRNSRAFASGFFAYMYLF